VGYLSTVEMLSSSGDVESVLSWHLSANHYPPMPVSMVAPCLAAIEAFADEDFDRVVELPDGVEYRDESSAPAWVVVEVCHLEGFL
jgi:hypothetical protein